MINIDKPHLVLMFLQYLHFWKLLSSVSITMFYCDIQVFQFLVVKKTPVNHSLWCSFSQVHHQGPAEPRVLRRGHGREGGAGRRGRRQKGLDRPEAVGGRPQEAEGQVQGQRSHRVHLRPGEGGPRGRGTGDGA